MRALLLIIAVGLILSGFLLITYRHQEQASQKPTTLKQMADQTASDVKDIKQEITARVEQAQEKAEEHAQKIQTQVQEQTAQISAAVSEKVNQAKEYLAKADYQSALRKAQEALNLDAASAEAKKIVEQAKLKLQETVKGMDTTNKFLRDAETTAGAVNQNK